MSERAWWSKFPPRTQLGPEAEWFSDENLFGPRPDYEPADLHELPDPDQLLADGAALYGSDFYARASPEVREVVDAVSEALEWLGQQPNPDSE